VNQIYLILMGLFSGMGKGIGGGIDSVEKQRKAEEQFKQIQQA